MGMSGANPGPFWHTATMLDAREKAKPATDSQQKDLPATDAPPREIGGPKGPEPTRFGDWERNGRCVDF